MLLLKSKSFLRSPSYDLHAIPKGDSAPHPTSHLMMAKRSLSPTPYSANEPKPKRKLSKKHDTSAEPKSQATACFDAFLAHTNVIPPGLADTPAKPKVEPIIKIEPPDGNAALSSASTTVSDQPSKKGKSKAKDKPKLPNDTPKAPAVHQSAGTDAGAAAGNACTLTAPDSHVVEAAIDVKARPKRQAVKPAVIDLSDDDEDADGKHEECEVESNDGEDEDDGELEGSSDDRDEDEDESEADMDVQDEKPIKTEKPVSTNDAEPAGVANPSKALFTINQTPRNDKSAMSVRNCQAEVKIYLKALARLPSTSSVIRAALQEMIYQWFSRGFNADAVRAACQDVRIVERLKSYGATSTRLEELSHMLMSEDLVQHFAHWIEKEHGAEMLRSLCAHQRDETSNPLPVSERCIRSAPPLPAPPPVREHHFPASKASGHTLTHQPQRRHGHDGHTAGSFNIPCYNLDSVGSATEPPVLPARESLLGLSRSGHHPPATQVAYVGGNTAKVFLVIVGTPDVPLAEADFDAYEFRIACENAFGVACIGSVHKWSANAWKIHFKIVPQDLFDVPIYYRHCVLYAEAAFRHAPRVFVSDFSNIDVSDVATFECVAAVFGDCPGTIFRLERGDKAYVIVKLKHAPGLLRFYAPMPRETGSGFMPAFKAYHHRDRVCLLCHTQHNKLVCPDARTLPRIIA